MSMDNYLYRALNSTEISKGCLMPKELGDFLLPPAPPLPVPFPIGVSEFMALYKHQYGEHYSTNGVSTTRSLVIALKKYGQEDGVVVKLDIKKMHECRIKILALSDKLKSHLIRCPEDSEVILVGEHFPTRIIVNVICSNPCKLTNFKQFKIKFFIRRLCRLQGGEGQACEFDTFN